MSAGALDVCQAEYRIRFQSVSTRGIGVGRRMTMGGYGMQGTSTLAWIDAARQRRASTAARAKL